MEYFAFVLFFSTFAFANVISKTSKELGLIYYYLLLIVAMVIGLRGSTDEYTALFVLVPRLTEFFSSVDRIANEKGYLFALICSIIKSLGLNSQALLLFFALTSVSILAVYYKKFTRYYFIAFLIYLSHAIAMREFDGLRMALASALVLPMIYCALNRQKMKFSLLLITSALIQYVGILSIIILLLRKRVNPNYLLFGLLASILILYTGIIKKIMYFLGDIGLLPSLVLTYLKCDTYVYNATLLHPKTAQQIILTLIVIMLMKRNRYHPSPYFTIIFNVYYISTTLQILFNQVALFAFRFGGHFYVVEPILIVYLSHYFVEKRVYLFVVCIGALIVAYINYIYVARLPAYELFVQENYIEELLHKYEDKFIP